jgi:hypothetical protein
MSSDLADAEFLNSIQCLTGTAGVSPAMSAQRETGPSLIAIS